MKHNALSMIASALVILLLIGSAVPLEASAASDNHNGSAFTITADSYQRQYDKTLTAIGNPYTLDLAEDFSDCNAQYYDMYNQDQKYTMTMVLYTNYETKKLETIRFYAFPQTGAGGFTDSELYEVLNLMLIGYAAANQRMTDSKWENMFTAENLTVRSDGCYFSGAFDNVAYSLFLSETFAEFIIE